MPTTDAASEPWFTQYAKQATAINSDLRRIHAVLDSILDSEASEKSGQAPLPSGQAYSLGNSLDEAVRSAQSAAMRIERLSGSSNPSR